jgi:two-component system nitrogen regulation response regulator NtrX
MVMSQSEAAHSVLIVDDEPEVRHSIRAMLEAYGYAAYEAGNAHDALAIIEGNQPSLVLTDIFLGDDDGYMLLNALRFGERRAPIIAMSGGGTGVGGTDVLAVAEKLGAVAIIDKPFRVSNLIEMIDRVLAGRGAPPRR